ncbi:flagellar protein FlaG [Campylobacter sp. RM9344]|uniref:Flagellar protein FlaG n=1 Tax=Campylobacter californiensis TaxID=1032243 RepID=A0AAW3ZRX6_9BACT|nr:MULTISPECIES: FlaG family protein [unclassified Campylobacter]MBE2983766.1 flagellar protein FlaG [Campylobacter sp. RM6883]MBE2985670.1 flagellar protein FlaG [Campylobacter sp. RM12919]MBE2987301.1 flagellar protein FlaG [Campylobacter sp. RM12920]MBE2994305.1 flagellar protein FlaG [Campylobacter sp. RM6913]MBE3028613.1 flagellar protein FlaG [Campylobacter sp. RM9344]
MEIFKVAANQVIDSTASISQSKQETRQVEDTQIQENLVNKEPSKKLSEVIEEEIDKLSEEDLVKKTKESTEKLNFQMEQLDAKVRFEYNDKLNMMVVQVKDAKTGEDIAQIPSKQAIKISEYFKESIGMLFDKES